MINPKMLLVQRQGEFISRDKERNEEADRAIQVLRTSRVTGLRPTGDRTKEIEKEKHLLMVISRGQFRNNEFDTFGGPSRWFSGSSVVSRSRLGH